jgi:hypothetical protein
VKALAEIERPPTAPFARLRALKPVTLHPQLPPRSVTLRSTSGSVLGDLIDLHFRRPPRILDASWGRGGIWTTCRHRPTVRLDKRALPNVDVVGDWNALGELFRPASFHAVIWDPPFQTDGGHGALADSGGASDWADRYGTADAELRGQPNISHLFPGFLAAAAAVLDVRVGCVLVKMGDQAHGNSRQQLQSVDFVTAARAAGWTVCEMIPLFTGTKPDSSLWRQQVRVRKSWCYWICAHPGPCRADGIVRSATCSACGDLYAPRRRDQHTCGRDRCRKRRSRSRLETVSQELAP